MKENYIKSSCSKRVQAERNTKKKVKLNDAIDVIDLRSEQPDAMADFFVVDALSKEASKWENRGYDNRETDSFNNIAAAYLEKHYGVANIDVENEINPTNGTSSALNVLALAFINGGDSALITKPSSTSLENMTVWLGGTVTAMPLEAKNKFYPKYEDISQKSINKAKLLYISYPNNPTGQSATIDFFKETIDFAKKNELIVLHDAAFAPLVYEDGRQLSFLSTPGAKKVGAELHSLSQGFNMAGWKVGFIAGNKNIIKAFKSIISKNGFGQYTPLQQAAAYALRHTEISRDTAAKYERRMDLLIAELVKIGFKAKKPKAGFYLYVKIPKGIEGGKAFDSSAEFQKFLNEHNILARAFDNDYIRFSVAYPAFSEKEEKNLMQKFNSRLKEYKLIF